MRAAPLDGNPLGERPACPEEAGAGRWRDLESGFLRTEFRDWRGVDHLRIYMPPQDVPEELWEVLPPKDGAAPLELLAPEYPEQ